MPRKVFTAGEVLAAADVNSFLMDQTVMSFAGTAARGSAIGTATEGMLTYLEDSDTYQSYDGSSWLPLISPGAWTAFTPTWNNLTIGNGVYNRSHFTQIGKTAIVAVDFTLGSTSAVTGDIQMTVPSGISRQSAFVTGHAQGGFVRTTATYPLVVVSSISNAALFLLRISQTETGTNPQNVRAINASATSPFTWTTGDRIFVSTTYEVA
jgi:hypothetical protein